MLLLEAKAYIVNLQLYFRIHSVSQVRRNFEGGGLEYYFASFWEVTKIEGAFSGPHLENCLTLQLLIVYIHLHFYL